MENNSPAYLVSLNECCSLTSLSRTSINNLRAKGDFPEAVLLGDRRIAFVRAEVDEWILDRVKSRRARAAA
ncbi:MAG: AlpA family phage regulatory protein [Afipia sp.]|nr:AlpA family phage regulatory protein [Afipia sp.]